MQEELDVSRPLDWETLEQTLPRSWRDLAVELGLIHPVPPQLKAKVKDISEILRLVLYQVATNSGLEQTVASFAAVGLLAISFVALHKWLKKIGPYLEQLVARMVAQEHAVFAPERWAGYELIVGDASCVERPGAKGTTGRVHYALRLTDLRPVEVHVTDETGGETLRRFSPKPDQLWILDRGYANAPSIAHGRAHGADVLIRHNRWSLPLYDIKGKLLDIQRKLDGLSKPGRVREWKAWAYLDNEKKDHPIAGRLIAVRLPSEKAAQARQRVRQEHGSKATEEQLWMAEFVVLFTTIPAARLSADLIVELYRLRWQIELEFKRAKSIEGLDKLPNFLPETIHSWICAKLLLQQMLRAVAIRCSANAFSPGALGTALLEAQPQAA
jgi:hypothetical protein